MLNFQKLKTTKCYGVTALWRCADFVENGTTKAVFRKTGRVMR